MSPSSQHRSNIKQPPNFPPLEDGNNAFAFCNAFAYGLNMSGILPPQVEGAAYLPHLVYTIAKANAECIQATRIPKPGFQLIYRTERDSVCERVASYVQGDPWQIPPICRLVVEGKFTELFKCVFYKVPIA